MKLKNEDMLEKDRRQFNLSSDTRSSPNQLYHLNFSLPYIQNKKVLDVGCWSGQFDILAVKFTEKFF